MIEKNDDIVLEDIMLVETALWILITRAMSYCEMNNMPFKITSIISDRKNVKAKTKTHEEGRAIDISSSGWTKSSIYRFIFIMNRDYAEIAAISSTDLKPRAVVYHDIGYGEHFHLQVRPNADLSKYIKD